MKVSLCVDVSCISVSHNVSVAAADEDGLHTREGRCACWRATCGSYPLVDCDGLVLEEVVVLTRSSGETMKC